MAGSGLRFVNEVCRYYVTGVSRLWIARPHRLLPYLAARMGVIGSPPSLLALRRGRDAVRCTAHLRERVHFRLQLNYLRAVLRGMKNS